MAVNNAATGKNAKRFMAGLLAMGGVIGVWSFSALLVGLSASGWQVSELLRHYMIALGMLQEHETFLDFYTYIKGEEYIISLIFLAVFPAFFKAVNKTVIRKPAASGAS